MRNRKIENWKGTLGFTIVIAISLTGLQAADPIREQLPPPELLLRKADEIGLSEEQREGIEKRAKSTHEAISPEVEKARDLRTVIAGLLQQTPVDKEAVADRFSELLKLESEVKQVQFSTMVEIRNQITPEQLEQVRTIMANLPPPDPALQEIIETQVKPKLQRVHRKIQEDAENGIPPSEAIRDDMERIHDLLKDGRAQEVLELLEGLEFELGIG